MAVKTANPGQFMIPTSPAAGTAVSSGAANTYTTNYVQMTAATSAALYVTGASGFVSSTTRPTYMHLQIATGSAGAEAIIGQIPGLTYGTISGTTGTSFSWYSPTTVLIPVANGARIAAKTADSTGGLNHLITLECIAQAGVVDAGVLEAVDISTIKTQAVTAAAGVTFPSSIHSSGAAVASVTGAVSSVTAAVTLPTIPANFITAAGISAGAYSGVTFSSGQTVASVSGAVSSVTAAVSISSGQTVATVTNPVTISSGQSVATVTGSVSSVSATVNANISKVNTVTVTGSGTTANPWGP